MKDLGKWQIISFISRGMATVLGLAQSFVIIRILSVGDWGIVQLATSIGGALGIYQHLGLASASTREISSAEDDKEIFKIFITSAFIRYCVTLPIAVGLFIFAKYLAVNIYHHDSLILPLKIYAISLLFQGMQSILNSVVSGTKRFKRLFLYQVVIAGVSLLFFVPLVYLYKVNGYFYAFLGFNALSSIILAFIALYPLRASLVFPSNHDFKRLFKEIFTISMAIYLVKIFSTNWEKLGPNVLGLSNPATVVAIFAFAMLFAKKILNISDSVTDVTLPVFSEKYVKDIEDFKHSFSKNFDKVFTFIILSAAAASFWAPELSNLLVGSNKYSQSFPLIPPMLFGYILYAFIDIVKSSVLIPAKMVKEMILSYVFLISGSLLFFFGSFKFIGALPAMAWAMVFGCTLSFAYMLYIIRAKLKFTFFNIDHAAILLQAYFIAWVSKLSSVWIKGALFVPLMLLLVSSFFIANFVNMTEVKHAKHKIFTKLKLIKL